MNIVARLDEARASIDVLEHPFYQRWNAGELSGEELALYAGEYRRAVLALAEASELAAREAPAHLREDLRRHAEEEASHVALWDAFAEAAGGAGAGSSRSPCRRRSPALGRGPRARTCSSG